MAAALVLHSPTSLPVVTAGTDKRVPCSRIVKELSASRDEQVRYALVEQLGIIRFDGARKRWFIDFRPYGRLMSIKGTRIASEQQAGFILRQIRAKVAGGRELSSVVAEYSGRSSNPNQVQSWLEKWMRHLEDETAAGQLSPRTLETIMARAADFAWWNGHSLHDIGPRSLVEWRDFMLRDREPAPLGRKTVKNTIGDFRTFLRWLQRDQRVLTEVPDFPSVSVPERLPTVVSASEQRAILAAIPEPRRGAFLAMCVGVRPSSARALTVRDFGLDDSGVGWLSIDKAIKGRAASAPVGGTKSGKGYRVPVLGELREWIDRRLASISKEAFLAGATLFPNPSSRNKSKRWHDSALRKEWHRARLKAGVTLPVGMYEGTKHTSGTNLSRDGVDLRTIQKLFGHADIRSTMLYVALGDAALVDAVGRLQPRPLVAGLSPAANAVKNPEQHQPVMVGRTGLEPVTSAV